MQIKQFPLLIKTAGRGFVDAACAAMLFAGCSSTQQARSVETSGFLKD